MEKNILIIEDDKDIREGVKILLEGEGYSVEEASNGADGLKKLTSHTNLVILDIMMPGISGLKTCEEIRKISYVPILFLTAKSKESDKLIGFMAGADDYLIKPFSYTELFARGKVAMGNHGSQGILYTFLYFQSFGRHVQIDGRGQQIQIGRASCRERV